MPGPKGFMMAEMGEWRIVLLARNFGPPLFLLPGRMKSFPTLFFKKGRKNDKSFDLDQTHGAMGSIIRSF